MSRNSAHKDPSFRDLGVSRKRGLRKGTFDYIAFFHLNTLFAIYKILVCYHLANGVVAYCLGGKAKGRFQSEKAIPTELYCTAAEGQPLLTPLPAAFCCCSLFLIITGCLHLVCCCFFFGVGLLCAELLHLGLIHNTRLGGEQEILRLEVSMHHTHEMADVNHIHNLSDDCGGFRLRVVPSPLHSSMTRCMFFPSS
ncbi:hypothetical protein AAZX31_14G206700 [Glycine max]